MGRWATRLLGALWSLGRRRYAERELAEEFEYHLERERQERQQAGLTPEAAHRAARLAMGAIETSKEQCRELRAGQRIAASVGRAGQDVRFALRLFRRHPAPVAIAVGGLALAISIATAVFSVVNAVALRGHGIAAPDELFRVNLTPGRAAPWRHSDFVRFRQARPDLPLAAADFYTHSFSGRPHPTATDQDLAYEWVTAVSGNYFSVLGARLAFGRPLAPADDLPGAPRALVVSHLFWKNRLGADPAVVGRTINVGGVPYTIIGIAHQDFTGQTPPSTPPPAAWITLTAKMEALQSARAAQRQEREAVAAALRAKTVRTSADQRRLDDVEFALGRQSPIIDYVRVFVRAPAGVRESTRGSLQSAALALLNVQPSRDVAVQLLPLDVEEARIFGFSLTALTGAVGLLVLLASANVANLLLAGAAGRGREIATRLALGASRSRVRRQLMTESLVLGAVAGAAGFGAALWLAPALAWAAYLPPALDIRPDFRVYAFVTGLTFLISLGAGLAPARQGARGDLVSAIKADRLVAVRGRMLGSGLRQVLIGLQAAGAVVLLVMCALLARSLVHTAGLDLGFDPNRVFSVDIGNSTNGRIWDPARRQAFWDEALARLRQAPGIESASLASAPPMGTVNAGQRLPDGGRVQRHETSPEFFETVGARILRGRAYTEAEVQVGAPVAVISERLARSYWGHEDPIGSSLQRVWGDDDKPGAQALPQRKPAGTRVIGVVEDTVTWLDTANVPTLYLPLRMEAVPRLVVRVEDDPASRSRVVQEILRSVDADVDGRVTFAMDQRRRQLEPLKINATLGAMVGLSALALAVVGLFGVTAFVARQRVHEIGVRLTLGATRRDIIVLLLRHSLTPVAAGLVIGLGAAMLSTRVLQRALYGVSPQDPLAMFAAAVILLAASLAAIVPTARRAARVDVVGMLRAL